MKSSILETIDCSEPLAVDGEGFCDIICGHHMFIMSLFDIGFLEFCRQARSSEVLMFSLDPT